MEKSIDNVPQPREPFTKVSKYGKESMITELVKVSKVYECSRKIQANGINETVFPWWNFGMFKENSQVQYQK